MGLSLSIWYDQQIPKPLMTMRVMHLSRISCIVSHNCDEAVLATNPVNIKVSYKRVKRVPIWELQEWGRRVIVYCFAYQLHEIYAPLFVVYKGRPLYQTWTNGGPDDTSYEVTTSEWMEMLLLENGLPNIIWIGLLHTKSHVFFSWMVMTVT